MKAREIRRRPHWLPAYPRLLNRAYAFVFGYFWLPCPLCGFYYGGHEWEMGSWVVLRWYEPGHGVCFNHTDSEIRAMNRGTAP